MAYYESNQPYNSAHQQKDGLANGAIIGGLMGGGLSAGVDLGGNKLRHMHMDRLNNKRAANEKRFDELAANGTDINSKEFNKVAKTDSRINRGREMNKEFYHQHKSAFGSGGWKRAGIHAGSAIAGSLLGAGADALMD